MHANPVPVGTYLLVESSCTLSAQKGCRPLQVLSCFIGFRFTSRVNITLEFFQTTPQVNRRTHGGTLGWKKKKDCVETGSSASLDLTLGLGRLRPASPLSGSPASAEVEGGQFQVAQQLYVTTSLMPFLTA